jgi:hypothetical protein
MKTKLGLMTYLSTVMLAAGLIAGFSILSPNIAFAQAQHLKQQISSVKVHLS